MSKILTYQRLSKEIQEKITEDMGPAVSAEIPKAVRRDPSHDRANLWRPAYIRDVEKIMH